MVSCASHYLLSQNLKIDKIVSKMFWYHNMLEKPKKIEKQNTILEMLEVCTIPVNKPSLITFLDKI